MEEQLKFRNIPKLIHEHRSKNHKKALWLLPTGIYSLVEFYQHPLCQQCKQPLHVLHFRSQVLPSRDEMNESTMEMLKYAKILDRTIQKSLNSEEVILFVPPIRALVVVADVFGDHRLLHQVCETNSAFCTDAKILDILREYYNIFCENWKTLVSDKKFEFPFSALSIFMEYQNENQGQHVVPVADTEDYTFAVETWADMLRTFIENAIGFDPATNSLFGDPLSSFPKGPEKQASEEIQQIAVVGEKHRLKELEKLNAQFPIRLIDEKVDFSEAFVKRLLHHQESMPGATIWLISPGIAHLTVEAVGDTHCSMADCCNSLIYCALKVDTEGPCKDKESKIENMVNNKISQSKCFAKQMLKKINPSSVICYLPVLPTSVILASKNTQHSHIHLLKLADPALQIFNGIYSSWVKCASHFDSQWKKLLVENAPPQFGSVLEKYFSRKSRCMNFVYSVSAVKGNSRFLVEWSEMVSEVLHVFDTIFHIRRDVSHFNQSLSGNSPSLSVRPPPPFFFFFFFFFYKELFCFSFVWKLTSKVI